MAARFPPRHQQRLSRSNNRRPRSNNNSSWSVDSYELERNRIEVNRDDNPKFHNARYKCRLCKHYIFRKDKFYEHITSKPHEHLLKMDDWNRKLSRLPPPSRSHLKAVSKSVTTIYEDFGIDEEERSLRFKVFRRLKRILQNHFPDVVLDIFGSSLTGLGLTTSDININLRISSQTPEKLPYRLEEVFVFLKEKEGRKFDNVTSHFDAHFPALRMTDISTNCTVELTINNYLSVCTSKLLDIYSSLDDHVEQLAVAFRYWAHLTQLCRNDQKDKACIPAHALNLMVIYFLQQHGSIPVCSPPEISENEPDYDSVFSLLEDLRQEMLANTRQRRRTNEVGELWLKMLRFYSFEKVVNICGTEVPRDKNPWNHNRFAVQDPYKTWTNVTFLMRNACIHDYWDDSIHKAYEFFATPVDTMNNARQFNVRSHSYDSVSDTDTDSDDQFYDFESLKDEGPTLVCDKCQEENHLLNACPKDELPPVLPLPNFTTEHLANVTEVLKSVKKRLALDERDMTARQRFLESLEDFIQDEFPGAELHFFGSSSNGFALKDSDVDIYLELDEEIYDEDKPKMIERLAKILKRNREVENVQAITTAKVPIVKFCVKNLNLEADISMSNILAARNTKLLYCYSQTDPRVQTLGCAIKYFVKVCDIGDADRCSLSSYAYILMMLYYLQQVKPPVIPVLQELYDGKHRREHRTEGWDTWFLEDLSKLDKLWPYRGRNKMSEAELWLGFFNFYVEDFDALEFVISIRQLEPLRKFYKGWQGPQSFFAIEDPFKTSQNLAGALTRNMTLFIKKTLRNGRTHFGTPLDGRIRSVKSLMEDFFKSCKLSEKRPQTAKGCNRCGKIGHERKDCPLEIKEKPKGKERHRSQGQERRRRY